MLQLWVICNFVIVLEDRWHPTQSKWVAQLSISLANVFQSSIFEAVLKDCLRPTLKSSRNIFSFHLHGSNVAC
jgi:hypothetical protein